MCSQGRPHPAAKQLPEAEFRTKAVQIACSYRGVPYRWGGKTPLGIACSGLCSLSYLLSAAPACLDKKMQKAF
ncbi:MAG: C40 family peptidase [Oscillospiraceae bacterium]|nr:C40 family peptidase [Oscillospiraceae bacterium]